MKWILSCKVGSCLSRLLAKLKGRFGGQLHYINGAQTLPPPLSRQEEEDFFKRLAGQDEDARQQLIVHNLRLVVYIAKKFESTGINLEDLISIGTIGLIKAVNTFSPEKKIKLATYASRCIENEILMYLRKNQNRRKEVSIDEPLNIDWDGNELLLSDILGTDADAVSSDIERDAERAMLHAAALWLVPKRQGAHPKGGGGPNRHLAVVHLAAGKAHHPSAAGGFAGGVLIDFDRYGKKRSAGNRSAPLIFWRNGEK